jgi:hypothetical protein
MSARQCSNNLEGRQIVFHSGLCSYRRLHRLQHLLIAGLGCSHIEQSRLKFLKSGQLRLHLIHNLVNRCSMLFLAAALRLVGNRLGIHVLGVQRLTRSISYLRIFRLGDFVVLSVAVDYHLFAHLQLRRVDVAVQTRRRKQVRVQTHGVFAVVGAELTALLLGSYC